jgi:hypothetical protein
VREEEVVAVRRLQGQAEAEVLLPLPGLQALLLRHHYHRQSLRLSR